MPARALFRAGGTYGGKRERRLLRHSPMGPDERYRRVIQEAARTLGGEPRLAAFLGVSAEQVRRWTSRVEVAPLDVFLVGLDVIARGRFARKRRIRVAVIDQRSSLP